MEIIPYYGRADLLLPSGRGPTSPSTGSSPLLHGTYIERSACTQDMAQGFGSPFGDFAPQSTRGYTGQALRALVTLRALVHGSEFENKKFLATLSGAPPAIEDRAGRNMLDRLGNDPKAGGEQE